MKIKTLHLLIAFIACSMNVFAQTKTEADSVKTKVLDRDSLLLDISQKLEDIDFRIRGLDRYKMYRTENIYTLLKLDTMTGKIEQVQWSLDNDKEGTWTINGTDLSYNTGCGTFELYATSNMYQFILLDKVTGRQWHVQWGIGDSKRWIKRIY